VFNMHVLLITLLLSVIRVFGIGVVNGEEFNENDSRGCIYYPLKTGAEWKLKGIGTTPSISFKILGTEKIEDISYFKIESTMAVEEHSEKNTFYARCEENRIYWLKPPYEERLKFDFNTEPNQSWAKLYKPDSNLKGARTGRIIDTNMTVEVPAGVFEKCLVYEITETSQKTNERLHTIIYTYWMAPEIGIVKMSVNIGGSALAPIDLWINNLSTYSIPD